MRLKLLSIILLFIFAQVVLAQDNEIAHRERWQVRSSLLRDTCGGAGEGASFPVILGFNANDELAHLAWFNNVFAMSPSGIPNGYSGDFEIVDANYHLDMVFTSPTSFIGFLTVTFDFLPNCAWLIRWEGFTH